MSRTSWVPNPAFAKELAGDAAVRAELTRKAREAGVAAQAIGRALGGSGAYANSIKTDGERVLSTDPAAHIVEWGSVNNPPYAPLRRAVESVGATYKDDV